VRRVPELRAASVAASMFTRIYYTTMAISAGQRRVGNMIAAYNHARRASSSGWARAVSSHRQFQSDSSDGNTAAINERGIYTPFTGPGGQAFAPLTLPLQTAALARR